MTDREPEEQFIRKGKLLRIIDADTLEVIIELGFDIEIRERVRLSGVDAPEIRGSERVAGMYVSRMVRDWFKDRNGELFGVPVTIKSDRYERGKFGRCIATVWYDGECLNDYLRRERVVWATDENGKLTEERKITNLSLPAAVLSEVKCQQLR